MGKFVEDTPTEPDHHMITNQGRRHTKHQLTMSVQGQTSPIRGNFGLAVAFPFSLPIYLFWSCLIVAVEKSSHYVQAAVTVLAALVLHCVGALTDIRWFRPAQQWAAGHKVDRATALEATYTFTRRAVLRALWNAAVWFALIGHCRCDRRGERIAAGPVQDPGCRHWNRGSTDRPAHPAGGSRPTSEGRDRR